MKLLVYGARGWIGSQFIRILEETNTKYICGLARANNQEKLREEILTVHPTHIVSFIGRTHGKIGDKTYSTIDYLEQPYKLKENIRDNLYSPLLLAMMAKEYGLHYTYLGTGCIFKFDNDHPG